MDVTFTNTEMRDIINEADAGRDGNSLPAELRLRFKEYCRIYNFPYPFKGI